jgi:hypothetical protein
MIANCLKIRNSILGFLLFVFSSSNMSSPTSGAVYRTGPAPVASDYSKTLIQALAEEDPDTRLHLGPVSRIQLLLTCLVERLHDAIYVLPRQAREEQASATPVDPDEYARDVAMALKGLHSHMASLPDDQAEIEQELEAWNLRLQELRVENAQLLEEAKSVREQVYNRLETLT